MWIGLRKEIRKLTFRALALRRSGLRTNARNVSFRIPLITCLRRQILIIKSVGKTKLSCNTPHRRSTTISLEAFPIDPNKTQPYCICVVTHTNGILFLFKIRRAAGKTPYYFPEKFGTLVGVKNRPTEESKQEFMLTYEIDEVMTSMVTLQISADDIILIYNRFVSTRNKMLDVYSG